MIAAKCETCGKVFHRKYLDHGKLPKFCSRPCFQRKKTVCCVICSTFFEAKKQKHNPEKREECCGSECKAKLHELLHWETFRCASCGIKVRRRKSRRKSDLAFCSNACVASFFSFKDGIYVGKNGRGYISAGDGKSYQLYHRFIVEKHLGRKLSPDEPIVHVDRNLLNNRLENLYLFSTMADMQAAIQAGQWPTRSNL